MSAGSSLPTPEPNESPAARAVRIATEALLLALIAFAPWPFASVAPRWTFVLLVGLALLTVLWAAHAAVTRRFTYHAHIPSSCLLGLVLLTAVQLVPLP